MIKGMDTLVVGFVFSFFFSSFSHPEVVLYIFTCWFDASEEF